MTLLRKLLGSHRSFEWYWEGELVVDHDLVHRMYNCSREMRCRGPQTGGRWETLYLETSVPVDAYDYDRSDGAIVAIMQELVQERVELEVAQIVAGEWNPFSATIPPRR